MMRHKDKRVDQAFLALSDALVSWERDTFRGSKLIFIPDNIDDFEDIIFLWDGKPVDISPLVLKSQLELIIKEVLGDE